MLPDKPLHYVVLKPEIVEKIIYAGTSALDAQVAWKFGMVGGSGATPGEALEAAREKLTKHNAKP